MSTSLHVRALGLIYDHYSDAADGKSNPLYDAPGPYLMRDAKGRYEPVHDSVIFHYTSLQNFFAISSANDLWLSHSRYSNDKTESEYFWASLMARVHFSHTLTASQLNEI